MTGDELRIKRHEMGLTQAQLTLRLRALGCGMSNRYIGVIEYGQKKVSSRIAQTMDDLYHMWEMGDDIIALADDPVQKKRGRPPKETDQYTTNYDVIASTSERNHAYITSPHKGANRLKLPLSELADLVNSNGAIDLKTNQHSSMADRPTLKRRIVKPPDPFKTNA